MSAWRSVSLLSRYIILIVQIWSRLVSLSRGHAFSLHPIILQKTIDLIKLLLRFMLLLSNKHLLWIIVFFNLIIFEILTIYIKNIILLFMFIFWMKSDALFLLIYYLSLYFIFRNYLMQSTSILNSYSSSRS